MKPHFDRMFRYVAWANQRVLIALKNCPAAQAEGTPLLAHLLAAEQVWFSRLQGREPALPVWPTLSLPECQALAAQCEAGWAGYMTQLREEKMQAWVEYRNSRGEAFVNSVEEILTHVITHGPYHRGQIAKVLGRTGGEAVNTDFIMFVRLTTANAG